MLLNTDQAHYVGYVRLENILVESKFLEWHILLELWDLAIVFWAQKLKFCAIDWEIDD